MEPTKETVVSHRYAWGGNTGNHGNKYEEDLAFALFERASLQKSEFKLASEMKDAGKFDDVVIIFEEPKEVWLFQAKHKDNSDGTNKISFDNLFPKTCKGNNDFAIIKYIQSYLDVIQKDEFKKLEMRFFILTNKSLDDSNSQLKELVDIEDCEQGEVNPIMKFAESNDCYKRFRPKKDKIEDLLKLMNTELNAIKDAIIELFEKGNVSDILISYKTPLQKILEVSDKKYLKLSKDRLTHEWLHNELLKDIDEKLIAENPAIKNFMNGKSRNTQLPTYLNEESVNEFFQHLTFCVNQPSDLIQTIENDLRSWMRDWIPPDDLGKAQLKLPFFKFNECFKNWINSNSYKDTKNNKPEKSYLSYKEGRSCVEEITRELSRNLSQRKYIGSSYIERKLIDKNRIVSDHDFIKRLIVNPAENKFSLFIGEPGMGKTTILQHIAFEVQKKSDIDVFLIYLNNLKEVLKSGCENLEAVFEISEISRKILRNNLESNANRTIILFDGFDEITFHNEAIAVFRQLLSKENIRVIVSGRYHVKDILEKEFKSGAIRLIPFENDEQIMVLKNSWKASDDSEEFEIYSTQLLEKFYSDIKSYQSEFFGIPLLIRLLAEVYSDDFQQYLKTVPDKRAPDIFPKEKFNVVSLFKKFVEFSFQIKWKKKRDQDAYRNIDMSSDDEERRQFKYFNIEHQIAAWHEIFVDKHKKIIASGEYETLYEELQTRIKQGNEHSPLFNISKGELRFVHRSYAEFFVATYIYGHIQKCKAILYETLYNHETVRRFFFMLTEEQFSKQSEQMIALSNICKKKPEVAFWACETNVVKVVKRLLQKNAYKTKTLKKYGSLLHTATRAGHYEMVLLLLDYGMDANLMAVVKAFEYSEGFNKSPLHEASEMGHLEIAKLLLDRSAKVDLQDEDNKTPLHYASEMGHLEIVKLLIDRSAKVDLQDEDNKTPLHYASESGHLEIVKLLLDRSAKVDLQDEDNKTPLHYASESGHLEIVKLLLDRSAKVDLQDEDNKTPLHYASESGHLEIVKLLLDRSAKVDLRDRFNRTPLHYATEREHLEIVKLLLERSATVDLQDEFDDKTPLHYASESGHLEIFKLLLDRSAKVDLQDEFNRTPLHYATEREHLEIVKLLLERSATVDLQDEFDDKTPLHYASESGHLEIFKLLLDRSAKVDFPDMFNKTPLHYASERKHLEIVKLLLERSANVDLQDDFDNKTPLHYASESGHLEIFKLLLDRSAKVDFPDMFNKTPLHYASKNGHLEIVKLLLDRSAKADLRDKYNNTPLYYASQMGHLEIVKLYQNDE
ncbi:uncharacterized protein LOC135717513 [Ochlerotatus camptorhynchus]|uniref:uncharacterized protein LOC135717513 n=1 Tax=Ochlerotatus camptorhynchus TaxID=644619 RepID=UPI0031D28B0C